MFIELNNEGLCVQFLFVPIFVIFSADSFFSPILYNKPHIFPIFYLIKQHVSHY